MRPTAWPPNRRCATGPLGRDRAGTLVLGENVSQAAQFAATGNTQGGIIAYSLALAPGSRPAAPTT
jgi:hypothetical protein